MFSRIETCLPNYLLNTSIPQSVDSPPSTGDEMVSNGNPSLKNDDQNDFESQTLSIANKQIKIEDENEREDKRQTRSTKFNNNCLSSNDVSSKNISSNGVSSNDEKKKFKFPKVAMKFCSNHRIKTDRKGYEFISSVPIEDDDELSTGSISEPADVTGLSDENVLDRCIPVPVSFFGSNNPFTFRDDEIRAARKLICTRRLEADDITKVKFANKLQPQKYIFLFPEKKIISLILKLSNM